MTNEATVTQAAPSQGTAGLWFLAYISPWIIVGMAFMQPSGDLLEQAIALVLSAAIAIPEWYGVSRRRTWGFYWVLGILVAQVPLTLPYFGGSTQQAVYSLIALGCWGVYLVKRRGMFYRKLRS